MFNNFDILFALPIPTAQIGEDVKCELRFKRHYETKHAPHFPFKYIEAHTTGNFII